MSISAWTEWYVNTHMQLLKQQPGYRLVITLPLTKLPVIPENGGHLWTSNILNLVIILTEFRVANGVMNIIHAGAYMLAMKMTASQSHTTCNENIKSWGYYCGTLNNELLLDDVIKWKHFPRYWRIVRGIHRFNAIDSCYNMLTRA